MSSYKTDLQSTKNAVLDMCADRPETESGSCVSNSETFSSVTQDATAPWHASIVTLFPEMFPGSLAYSIAGRACEKKMWSYSCVQIRDFATDKHHTVDDTPYGGGVGLVMKADIVHQALCYAKEHHPNTSIPQQVNSANDPILIYMSPRGEVLTQKKVRDIANHKPGVIILCGRYEGVDDRLLEHWREHHNLIELSIGDYVLSGGEVAALTLLDACVRVLPGVLPKEDATTSESFELDLLEFSQYTKPCIWQNKVVPEVLLSGDHSKIAAWRLKSAQQITQTRRPDIWDAYQKRRTNVNYTQNKTSE